ncbi:hypothetical protein ES288_D02G067200v1 [Gossypium darwinii]|uniref:CCHC-type domain-containing protein n=1 Tax=Gossypium darwinii TaxID=34276 RepID=A0A5D2D9L8_GOSDA|nr:hypothetical protein ES288_D02G067200v1 [Gossypium darwinii]
MKNHESRPTSSTLFLEANVRANVTLYNREDNHASSHGQGHGHDRGQGYGHERGDHKDGKNDKDTTGKVESLCYRCGGKTNWSRTYRTPKHLMKLYQQSLKDKDDYGIIGTTHLEVVDFFTILKGNN